MDSRTTHRAEDDHYERIGRVLNDFRERHARGESVSEQVLFAAHPDIADELRENLALLGDLAFMGDGIRHLVQSGTLRRGTGPVAAALGSYQIERIIGRGGMGIVLEAEEPALERRVAVKILRPEYAADPSARRRFEVEAKAAAAVRHPNIVAVHAVGEERGVPYVAMEYVPGTNLAEFIRAHGPLSAHLARPIFEQILAGLEAAHEQGLIHRDIKPSNILLEGVGASTVEVDAPTTSDSRSLEPSIPKSLTAKITDFGLAKLRSMQTSLTHTNSLLGTPEYMSPEQVRGEKDLDQRTDLYSAGVVLYEMLTGESPFRADSPSATLHRILHERPRDPRETQSAADDKLSALASRLMEKRAEDRVPSAGDTLVALRAGRTTSSPRVWRMLRRRVLFTLVLAALGLVASWAVRWENASSRRVRDVRIDPQNPQAVLVRRGTSSVYEVLYQLPAHAPVVWDALMLDLDTRASDTP